MCVFFHQSNSNNTTDKSTLLLFNTLNLKCNATYDLVFNNNNKIKRINESNILILGKQAFNKHKRVTYTH